jgi:hypothetical protein
MKGTIRVFVGLLIIMGVAGGIDTATDSQLLALIPFALVGFGLMISGANAINKQQGY